MQSSVNKPGMENGHLVDGHHKHSDGHRLTAEEMDEKRTESVAYEYLCHLEETKVWIEACINESIPPTVELEEGLRNGVILGKLGHFISPEVVPLHKLYDKDMSRYKSRGLHFRHTDNINYWFRALEDVGLPQIFYPETLDIYDRKNMPRVIYCLHALSLYLFKLGRAPQIQDLYGKIRFTDEEINNMRRELEKYGIQMPAFSKIGGILANEMPVDEAALHAAVIAINDAVDHQIDSATLDSLKNPAAHLVNIVDDLMDAYQDILYQAKSAKSEIARNKSVHGDDSYVPDIYDELLTQAEIQGNLNKLNVTYALSVVDNALDSKDSPMLLSALKLPYLRLQNVSDSSLNEYMGELHALRQAKLQRDGRQLSVEEVTRTVAAVNEEAENSTKLKKAVDAVNEALEVQDSRATLSALQNPKLVLPPVVPFGEVLYFEELKSMKAEKQEHLDYEEICGAMQVLDQIVKINRALEMIIQL